MARFYVGQRVRILWSRDWPELNGTEGRIVDLPAWAPKPDPGESYVCPDLWGTPFIGPRRVFCPFHYQLEPILNPPHEACDEGFKRDLDRLLDRQGVAS